MEIGSEFWKRKNYFIKGNETLFQSGRTALEAIIRDAIKNYAVTSAILPSYCCDSMIEPFIRNNISVRFYEISFGSDNQLRAVLPEAREHEIILFMTYFGASELNELEQSEINKWAVSIEDRTHSCFSGVSGYKATYSFESYRKWFALDGLAVARKNIGRIAEPHIPNYRFSELRNTGFDLKSRFMDGENIKKQDFLDLFSLAGQALAEDYIDKSPTANAIIDYYEIICNIGEIREIRKRNAEILRQGIEDITQINVLTDNSHNQDCPLFLGISVNDGYRNQLREYLIKNHIYCPVHWPVTAYHEGLTRNEQVVYSKTLSLICDQRYSVEDMLRFANCIQEFFKVEVN